MAGLFAGPGAFPPFELGRLLMFTFTPLPLASQAGLLPASVALDSYMPDPLRDSAARLQALLNRRRKPVSVSDLRDALVAAGELDAADLVSAVWESWLSQRAGVSSAVQAAAERSMWAARRRVADSPEARRQLRSWSQQAAELVPPAVQVADRAARTINDAAHSITTTTPTPGKRFPSWA